MTEIISIANQKGGVGKTTTATALISGLHLQGKRVLGVDLDPQGNLGFSFGVDIENSATVYDLLRGKVSSKDAIQTTNGGDIIPSNILLSGAELEFNRAGREFLLRDTLADCLHSYDYIIIDTPPALNVLTINAYTTATGIIVPMIPEILGLLGIAQLKETIQTVKKYYNTQLEIIGILLTKYNKRTNLTKEVEEMTHSIARELNTVVMSSRIRSSIAAAEAPAHCQSVLEYAPKSNAALDYAQLVQEILLRGKA